MQDANGVGPRNRGDQRSTVRLMPLVTGLVAQPDGSVNQACGNTAATRVAYGVWRDPAAN